MDQYIGKMLDNRYEILERIGTGGMAQVYKAKCHWLNRYVAIKILKDDLAQDEEFARRFHEESQAIAMLSHPNIVSVYDVSKSGDPDYIVMELIEGITLKQYMQKRGGKLTWKEALHFITQIMRGLSHAHSRGIVHRDIKPHNIMILRDGTVKVTDFGIARLVSQNQNTMTQEAIGSVHYISPEQARGSHIDARSDIYSAGVVLYEMLTGRLPFEGDSPVAVAIQHINSVPLSPGDLDPAIPEALVEITMKAMAPDVEKRYVSADAMLADLEEFRKNPNISFEYTAEDLEPSGEDEPTQNIGANTPTSVPLTPVHADRLEDSGRIRRTRAAEPEKEEDDEDDRGSAVGVIVTILLALLLVAGAAWFLWSHVLSDMLTTGKVYSVPNVIGLTLEEAQKLPAVTADGFTVVEGRHVASSDVPVGRIVSQSPAKGDLVKAGGQEITVEISRGGGTLSVPDLYNMDQRLAEGLLRSAGLTMKVEEANSDEIVRGNVISQSPAANETIEDGGTVTVVVSMGKLLKDVPMISLKGMTLEKALDALEELGLTKGGVKEVYDDEIEAGKVCNQSVPAFSLIKEETIVDLEVSKGPDPAATPKPTESEKPGETPEVSPDVTVEPSTAPSAAPTVEPTAEPAIEPAQEPAPTPAAPVVRTKTGTVELPDDRETVTVQVTVGGVPQYGAPQVVETRMRTFRYTMQGSGVQDVVVFIDGVAVSSHTVNFDS